MTDLIDNGVCLFVINASKSVDFYARKRLLLSRVLAVAVLSVRPSVTRVDQSKTVQASITKS